MTSGVTSLKSCSLAAWLQARTAANEKQILKYPEAVNQTRVLACENPCLISRSLNPQLSGSHTRARPRKFSLIKVYVAHAAIAWSPQTGGRSQNDRHKVQHIQSTTRYLVLMHVGQQTLFSPLLRIGQPDPTSYHWGEKPAKKQRCVWISNTH